MYGVGQGLADGVKTAGQFLIPVLRDKYQRQADEALLDKRLTAEGTLLDKRLNFEAGREGMEMPGQRQAGATPAGASPTAPASRGPMSGATPGEALIAANGMPSPMPAPTQAPLQQVMPAPMPGMTPGAAMAQSQDPNESLTTQQLYEMGAKSYRERLANQTRTADEIDVARNWQKNNAVKNNFMRSLKVIEAALRSKDPNQVLMLVPGAEDPAQARQVLAADGLQLRHQLDLTDEEFKLWDQRREELGIDPNEIRNAPDISAYLNRLQMQQRAGRASGRSVVPRMSRSGVSR